ncbi:uncharacterized protein [Montipora foliosa]|uniref:uncharacterized protein isoform X2 n=1 Tax=Montipora foliosa TaxID=591990 RepID=UPI0035F10C2E
MIVRKTGNDVKKVTHPTEERTLMMAVCDGNEMFPQTDFEGYILPWDRFKRWVTCLCVVTFDLELGQALELVYPAHVELTDREKTSIYLAFPDSNSDSQKGAHDSGRPQKKS